MHAADEHGQRSTSLVETEAPVATRLISSATELSGFLAEKAPETEAARQVLPEVVTALRNADLLTVGAPTAFGGSDVDIDTVFEICYELGRGCTSTAWCWAQWQTHAWAMGFAPQQAQEEFFAGGPGVLLSSGANPAGATVESADGGCRLSGQWGFSSGVDHADWVMVGGRVPGLAVPPPGVLILVPRDEIRISDDWYVMGLKGTGSKTVVIDEPVFVPDHRYLVLGDAERGPAASTHGRPSYAVPFPITVHYVVAAPLLAAARAAIDSLTDQMKVGRHSFTKSSKSESVAIQLRIAEATAEVDAALSMARIDFQELLEIGARGEALTTEQRATYRLHHCYIALTARRAVGRLFEVSGTAGMFAGAPLQRLFCDIHAASKQIALLWDENAESYGRVRLGLEPNALYR